MLCRLEGKQEAAAAKAFEAASQAKALVRSWKRPCLTAGHSPLPVEMWGLVLEQLLTQDALWDLPATAQNIAHVSLACKDMYMAAQRQGWPKLSSLLSPQCPPQFLPPSWTPQGHGQLLSQFGHLLTDPEGLKVPELREACKYHGLPTTGSLTYWLMLPQLTLCLSCLSGNMLWLLHATQCSTKRLQGTAGM